MVEWYRGLVANLGRHIPSLSSASLDAVFTNDPPRDLGHSD